MKVLVTSLCAAALLAGCERDPVDVACPPVAAGELVFSELNTAGSPVDEDEQWIEVFNASAGDVNLAGATVRLRTLNGTRDSRIVVRSADVVVPAGGYAVLGNVSPDGSRDGGGDSKATYIDYGYLADFTGNLPEPGALDLLGCDGALLDRVIVRDFPNAATLSFDGARPPAAADNDEADPTNPSSPWCEDGAATGDALGTPGQANRPCAP